MSRPRCAACARRERAKLAPVLAPRLAAVAAARRGRPLTAGEVEALGERPEPVLRALARIRGRPA